MPTFDDKKLAARAGAMKGRHKKSIQWEALSKSILGEQTGRFNEYLNNLWESNPEQAADLFLKVLNYFKPKIAYNINDSKEKPRLQFNNVSNVYTIDDDGKVIK